MPIVDMKDIVFDSAEQQEKFPSYDDQSPYDDMIFRTAQTYEVDPHRIRAIIRAESNFNTQAISHAGAEGLMQLMPATAKGLGVKNSRDPIQNVHGGTQYYAQMLKKYDGDTTKAHAAYNAGPGNIDKAIRMHGPAWLENLGDITGKHAKETQEYVKKVERFYGEYRPQKVENLNKRADGTLKGKGYLGELVRPDGKVSTELSISVDLGGEETQIPLLVPTLKKSEIDKLLSLPPEAEIPEGILNKAVKHAQERMANNLSPFYQEDYKEREPGPDEGTFQDFDKIKFDDIAKTDEQKSSGVKGSWDKDWKNGTIINAPIKIVAGVAGAAIVIGGTTLNLAEGLFGGTEDISGMPGAVPLSKKDYQPKPVDTLQAASDIMDAIIDNKYWEAGKHGAEASVVGMGLREALPPPYETDGRLERFFYNAGVLAPDLPIFMAAFAFGSFAGGGANPVTGSAAAFGLHNALRYLLTEKFSKGNITTPKEFVDRFSGTLIEAAKGGIVGAATGVTGKFIPGVTKLPAEIAVMTTVAAGLEGHLPTWQDFEDGVLLLGALKIAGATPGKLDKIYKKHGVKPLEVVDQIEAGTLSPEIAKELNLPKEQALEAVKKYKADQIKISAEEQSVIDTLNQFREIKELPLITPEQIVAHKKRQILRRRAEGAKKTDKFREEKGLEKPKKVTLEESRGKQVESEINKESKGLIKYDGEQPGAGSIFTTQKEYNGMIPGQTFTIKGKPTADKIKKAILEKAVEYQAHEAKYGVSQAKKNYRGPVSKGKVVTKETLPKFLAKDDYAIITAENPQGKTLSAAENAKRNFQMREYMDKEGIEYVEAKGSYGEVPENPVMITGITRKQALELGKRFDQEAIVNKDGMFYQDGTMRPSKGIEFGDIKKDFTTVKIAGENVKFSMQFDWGAEPVKAGKKFGILDKLKQQRGSLSAKEPNLIKIINYSSTEKRGVVKPKFMGKGQMGAERKQFNLETGELYPEFQHKSNWYVPKDKKTVEARLFGSKYVQEATVDLNKLYHAKPGEVIKNETALKNQGYEGYYYESSGQVRLFVDKEVTLLGKSNVPGKDYNKVTGENFHKYIEKPKQEKRFNIFDKLREEKGAVGSDITDINKFMKQEAAEQAKLLKKRKYAGSINLERQKISEAAKTVERQMFEDRGKKPSASNKEQIAAAEKILNKWRKEPKEWVKATDRIKKGKTPTIEEELAHRMLNADNFELFIEMGKAVEKGDVTQLEFDNFHSAMKLQAVHVTDPLAAEAGRRLQSYNVEVGKHRANKAILELKKDMNDRQFKAFTEVDWDNPAAIKAFIRELPDPKMMDYVYEFWYNNILSGIPTHLVNTTSTGLWTSFQVPHKTLVASIEKLASPFVNKQRTAYLNEIGPMLSGYARGAKRGVGAAKETLLRGRITDFETKWAQEIGSAVNAWQRSPHKILREAAPWMSVPTKGLRAMDVFFNSIAFDGEIASFARRLSNQRGLKGAERAQFETNFRLNPTKEASASAMKVAKYSTFMDDPGWFSQLVIRGRSAAPGGRFVIPFVNTIGNLLKRGVEMTPGVGLALSKGQPWSQVVAKQIEGAIITYAVMDKISKGELVGDAPDDPAQKAAFYREGKLPWSIRIGDKWVSYRRAEPFNTILAAATIAHEKITRAKDDDEASTIFLRITDDMKDNFIDSAYMSGVSRLFFQRYKNDNQNQTKAFAQNTIAGFVPYSSFFHSMARSFEAGLSGDALLREKERPEGAWYDPYVRRLPGFSSKFPPKQNIWGEDIKIEGNMFRQWLPFKASTATSDPVEKGLEKLNVYPGFPAQKIKHQGKMITLDKDIYHDYVAAAGAKTYEYYSKLMSRERFSAQIEKAQKNEKYRESLAKNLHDVWNAHKKKYRRKALGEQLKRNKQRKMK